MTRIDKHHNSANEPENAIEIPYARVHDEKTHANCHGQVAKAAHQRVHAGRDEGRVLFDALRENERVDAERVKSHRLEKTHDDKKVRWRGLETQD